MPRIALMRTFAGPGLNPPLVKLGELRIRCSVEDITFWLDEVDNVRTVFSPWGTVHTVPLPHTDGHELGIEAILLDGHTIGVEVSISPADPLPVTVQTDLIYGGIAVKDKQLSVQSYYFASEPGDGADNALQIADGRATLSCPAVPGCVWVMPDPSPRMEPAGGVHGLENGVALRRQWQRGDVAPPVRLLIRQVDECTGTPPDINLYGQYAESAKAYYRDLIAPYTISTPDQRLNAAFYASVLNLDYGYDPPAWFEGLHKWNAFLVNNYQISAAVSLGQLTRARDALLLFAERTGGPGQWLNADGSTNNELGGSYDEGLPYYILQLHRYWRASGDAGTLERVWEETRDNLEGLFSLRDRDGNLLLDWHQGCNSFLYQADHLALPGDATSPTIMVAHCLDLMADMAVAVGEDGLARTWRHRSDAMRDALIRRLWSREDGRFVAAIDPQGLTMEANYYTDFVFPQLYGGLPVEYASRSLQALDRKLTLENGLMRVGNYLPPLFGNNNVAPVQMAEAAEAYFRAGRADDGVRLLAGVARAVTTYTDSPGSFPERMSDSGFGQPDYGFGNPAGSYARAMVAGLFGFERSAPGEETAWQPAIPPGWGLAELEVTGATLVIKGSQRDRVYEARFDDPCPLTMRLPTYAWQTAAVTDMDGRAVRYDMSDHPSGGFLHVTLPAASHHAVRVTSEPVAASAPLGPARNLPAPPEREARMPDGPREALDLRGYFNASSVPSRNFWRAGPVPISLATHAPDGSLCVGPYTFQVQPTGSNLVAIELGELHHYTNALQLSSLPSSVTVPVGRRVAGLELLLVSEMRVRLTGMEAGTLTLEYSDGQTAAIPLVYGRNLDCMTKPFATGTTTVEVGTMCSLYAIPAPVDTNQALDSFSLRLFAADATLGLLAVNAVCPEGADRSDTPRRGAGAHTESGRGGSRDDSG